MAEENNKDPGYPEDARGKLELVWGEGFLSPGGPTEVSRILGSKSISGCRVLDIGSGTGGVDVSLVRDHGAGSVVGIDVHKDLIDLASSRARKLNLENQIKYQLVTPGLLPFADESFDVAFSKDAIVHVRDKEALYTEILRILCPGGRLLVSDWLRGDGDALTPMVEEFITASGHDFTLVSLRELGRILEKVGFADIELEDRRDWYLKEATGELEKLRGPLNAQFLELWGEEATQDEITFWEVLVAALEQGAIRPGHTRAVKSTGAL
jgi:phosphoethanolamine N-methyltransferase